MDYKQTTMVPNEVFSKLPSLSEKELKVVLVIIRQTIGWVDTQGKRKTRDWISSGFFVRATGLSRKSVSSAITLLIQKNLIAAETKSGKSLASSEARKGRLRTFYRCLLVNAQSSVKITSPKRNILPTTKLTQTKLNQTKHLTDYQRYLQIVAGRD